MTLAILPRAQISSAPLFSIEQFAAGNYTIGRGYDPGTLTGDSGVGFQAELRYDRFGILPKYQVGVQPYAFVDTEWLWNRGTPSGFDPQQLTSVGAGTRISWADKARLDVTVAVPVRDVGPVQSGDVRVLVSLTTRLVPWGNR
jgi:hemolysin activation/secretion protein